MNRAAAGALERVSPAIAGALVLLVVYALTLAPDVTFWDAGEFIAAAHSLGIPHPPGTPLFILLLKAWATLLPLPFAVATNAMSAVATATAAGITAHLVHRATQDRAMAFATALATGAMSTAWLNATETEVYASSLLLGILMTWAGERAGREDGERWLYVTAYLIALAVPLHLSALVAAPAAIVLASLRPGGLAADRLLLLGGVLVIAGGTGRMSWPVVIAGVVLLVASVRKRTHPARLAAVLGLAALGVSALAFLYLRAQLDPAINQGDSHTLRGFTDMVARRQYDVAPMWPRKAPIWLQVANFGQYADWQVALSLGPTVMPALGRSLFTAAFFALGYTGALAHWTLDRRTWFGVATLFACGSLGVVAYLNLHAGPSVGHGILPSDAVHEARERDYFFVFAFWSWGVWVAIGALTIAHRLRLPAWTGILSAALPIALNWSAVTRQVHPERALPRTFAEALLESTPRNGVLFVSGDNDSYPLWYAQEVRDIRTDVAVITIPLLPTDWYRAQIAQRFNLLDSASLRRYHGNLETAAGIATGARRVGRPVAAALTLLPEERARLGQRWSASGMVFVEGDGIDTLTTARIARRVDDVLGARAPRDAIDPVNAWFRTMLDCPRQWLDVARSADSARLAQVCNHR